MSHHTCNSQSFSGTLSQSYSGTLITLNVILRYFIPEYHIAFVYLIEGNDNLNADIERSVAHICSARGANNLYVHEPQHTLGRGLLLRKAGLSSPLPNPPTRQ